MSEEDARKKFETFGPGEWAQLLREDVAKSIFGPMRTVIDQTAVVKLNQTQSFLKDHLKRRKHLDRSIVHCKTLIKQLKKEIAEGKKV
jgi:hypothetical protein